ncbi:hypothetical protein DO021_21525 [Desulfobacter hydrogenophilus]|uniref:Uncharacterized protein n=1 Tax=Desulfobacter hydrogenophilus TaxID=2291 RepID=A0A328F6I5_9BACT|nr:hypothetical protein [Desulfobacter hydrogenophilus]NDY74462.1 hypothetical protein [Desulfobacter hydrogenophilus]QBH14299.1 hypothetical protein EYB58_16080 [Desulfobacter hydrogenophilus]RAL99978.1 hypothetical protein DO021_21525 [Desulfobacter hydrogenophilus]
MTDKKRKPMDPDTEAALAIVDMEQKQDRYRETEQQTRERLIAKCHEVIGRVQGLNMISEFANVSNFVWLKQVKDSKIYKDLPEIGTWDKFCNYIGLSRQKVDLDLQNLTTFGEAFLLTVGNLNVGYRDLKKLRQLTHEGSVAVDANSVTIGEEKIPLTPERSEDLQLAIESLLEAKNREIEDKEAQVKAKERILKDKSKTIDKQAHEISLMEGKAKKNGYTPIEESQMRAMDNSRTIIDGLLMEFDPERNPLPPDATPRMRAKLMHTLDYFRRVILATYDTAADEYGEPEIDDDWIPPPPARAFAQV